MIRKKVLILSTWDYSGSGIAVVSMAKHLIAGGYDVRLLVRDKTRGDDFVVQVAPKADKFSLLRRIARRVGNFHKKPVQTDPKFLFLQLDERKSLVTASDILEHLPFTPDVIVPGMISGFINTEVLADLQNLTGAKVYMLSVDMAPLTGGCHYAWDCKGYQNSCENCPAILSASHKDLAAKNLSIKKKNIERGNIQLLAGSVAVEEIAVKSTLYKDQGEFPITNGFIEMSSFNPDKRGIAREVFNLPKDGKIIFSGSTYTADPRKGYAYFFEALNILWNSMDVKSRNQTYVMVAGSSPNFAEFESKIPFKVIMVDYIKDQRLLSIAYQAVDVFVCSSTEDVGPLMVPEALACGTPVVGFDIGYMKQLVVNGYNGFKVPNKDAGQMADSIKAILELDAKSFSEFSRNATRHIEQYSSDKYLVQLFNELMTSADEREKSSHTAV